MAENCSESEPEKESDQKDSCSERALHKGCSRFSRKENISDWLSRKEKIGPERVKPTFAKRARSSLNKVSKKQKKKNSQYDEAKKEHYSSEDNRICALCGTTSNLSIHHSAKRGNRTDDKSTFITLCLIGNAMEIKYPDMNHSHSGGCHGFVEGNKTWARKNNYLE